LLNGVLALHDVEDVEKLCRAVLAPFERRGMVDDFEDALAELVGVCWQLGERYDRERDRRPNFAAYASLILSLRVHDRIRRVRGRTKWSFREERRESGRLPRSYERERPVVLSLDAPVGGPGQMCAECRQPVFEGGAMHDGCRRRRVARRNAEPIRAAHRTRLHRSIRLAVLRRDSYRCFWCGGKASTCDYVRALAAGGEMSLRNAVAACRSCNSRRGGGVSRGGRGASG
jgi:hypothetical protein